MQDRLKDHFKEIVDTNTTDRIHLKEIFRADRQQGDSRDKIERTMGHRFYDKYTEAYEFEAEYSAFLEGVRLGFQVAETALG